MSNSKTQSLNQRIGTLVIAPPKDSTIPPRALTWAEEAAYWSLYGETPEIKQEARAILDLKVDEEIEAGSGERKNKTGNGLNKSKEQRIADYLEWAQWEKQYISRPKSLIGGNESLISFRCQNPDCKSPKVNISRSLYEKYYRGQKLCLCCRDNAGRGVKNETAKNAARQGMKKAAIAKAS